MGGINITEVALDTKLIGSLKQALYPHHDPVSGTRLAQAAVLKLKEALPSQLYSEIANDPVALAANNKQVLDAIDRKANSLIGDGQQTKASGFISLKVDLKNAASAGKFNNLAITEAEPKIFGAPVPLSTPAKQKTVAKSAEL